MMKRVLALLSKPLPGWLTLVLILSVPALAAMPVFYGTVVAGAASSNNNAITIQSGVSSGFTSLEYNTGVIQGIGGTALSIGNKNTTQLATFDLSGNAGVLGKEVAGFLESSIGGATPAYAPPIFTTAGAALASTTHGVYWTTTYAISGTCANNTTCTPTSGSSVSLTGSAVFAGTSTAACGASDEGTAGFIPSAAINGGGAGVQLTLYNGTGSGQTGSVAINVVCTGT